MTRLTTFVVAYLVDPVGAHVPAVAEHGEAPAEAAHLGHAVRDEDDRHAFRVQRCR